MTRVEQQQPDDDTGAEVQANFYYQHCCAASWCVRMLGQGRVTKVLCETHEDFAIVYSDGASELVSVKHREGSTWTVAALCSEGVLGGLLDRWQRLGEEPRCRFMTNGDWASGTDNAAGLAGCCPDGDSAVRLGWADRLAPRLGAGSDVVNRLLSTLTFDKRPGREHIVPVEAVHLRAPLRDLQIPDVYTDRYFTAIAERIARASRTVGRIDLEPEDLRLKTRIRRKLAARTIDRSIVIGVLLDTMKALSGPLLGGEGDISPSTRLVRKLEAGGVPPTSVENAKRLRAAWTDHETRWRTEVPGSDAEWSDLRARILDEAARAERAVDHTGPYGTAMLNTLDDRLRSDDLTWASAFAVDDRLLLGLAFQLTDECWVWWSPRDEVIT